MLKRKIFLLKHKMFLPRHSTNVSTVFEPILTAVSICV